MCNYLTYFEVNFSTRFVTKLGKEKCIKFGLIENLRYPQTFALCKEGE